MIMTTWVINTNTNTCHIYDYEKKNKGHLNLIKEIDHPENKLRDVDLISSRPGRQYRSGSTTYNRDTYSQRTDPKEHAIDMFAREIATTLKKGREQAAYEELIVIAEPHMNGLLFKHLDEPTREGVRNKILKDVMFLKPHELLKFLQKHTEYPDTKH